MTHMVCTRAIRHCGPWAADFIAGGIDLRAHFVGSQFGGRVVLAYFDLRFADGQEADLFRGHPQGEAPGVVFDQESDEPLVGAERGAVNAQRRGFGVVAGFVHQAEPTGDGESTWLVAMVNSRPETLQSWTSILGP